MLDTHFKWFKDTQADYLNIFSLSEVDDWSDDNKSPSEYYCVVGSDDVMSSRRGSHEAAQYIIVSRIIFSASSPSFALQLHSFVIVRTRASNEPSLRLREVLQSQ